MRVVQTLCRWDRAVYPRWIHPDKLLIDIGGLRPHSQLLTTGCCPPSRPSWTRNTFTLVFYRITKSTAQYISVAEYHNTFTTQVFHKYQPQSGTTNVCICSFDGDGICKSTEQYKSWLPYIFVRLNGFRGAVSGKRPNAPWGHLYKIHILLRPYWLPI